MRQKHKPYEVMNDLHWYSMDEETRTTFYNITRELNAYGMRCGYVEAVRNDAHWVEMYHEHATFHVRWGNAGEKWTEWEGFSYDELWEEGDDPEEDIRYAYQAALQLYRDIRYHVWDFWKDALHRTIWCGAISLPSHQLDNRYYCESAELVQHFIEFDYANVNEDLIPGGAKWQKRGVESWTLEHKWDKYLFVVYPIKVATKEWFEVC